MDAPKLRFKEFNENWILTSLESIASNITAGKSIISKKKPQLYPILGSTGVIGYTDSYKYDGNYILIARVGANAGKVSTFNGKCNITDNTIFFECNNSQIDFLKELLIKQDLSKKSFGSGQPLVKASELKTLKITIPSLEEQYKIGGLFKKLNLKIQYQQEKINMLIEQKKGFMQKIFSQEIRFKDENRREFSQWDLMDLGNVVKVNSGRDYKHLNIGDIPVYGTGGYMLGVNESLSDEDAIGIGRKGTINQPQKLLAPFWTVDTLFYCTSKKYNDLDFIYILFQYINWGKYDESTGVPSLSKKTIEGISCNIPCYEEQKKIGLFFKKINERILLESDKLIHLENQKKAFVQQMYI